MAGISSKNGWGVQSALQAVTQVVAGVQSVIPNVGVGLQIVASSGPIRLSKLLWRVDLAPDIAAGTGISPVRWRIVVLGGAIPVDVSAFQKQAFVNGARPEIPSYISNGTPVPVLYDAWLDFSTPVPSPGLNGLASEEFADSGPAVAGGSGNVLSALLVPILDGNLPQAPLLAVNALMTIAAYGLGASAGVLGAGRASDYPSIPRYDVNLGGGI